MDKQIEKGYLPVELPFYNELNWNFDLIIRCLDVFRLKLSDWIESLPDNAKYDLISLENPFGPPYPAIGISCDGIDLPNFINLNEDIETLVTDDFIKEIVRESNHLESITWQELKEIKTYSEPPRKK